MSALLFLIANSRPLPVVIPEPEEPPPPVVSEYFWSSDQEIQLQKERYHTPGSPFTSLGNPVVNAPNEKQRLLNNANQVVANNTVDLYDPPLPNGWFDNGVMDTGARGLRLKDCAYVYLITGDKKYLNAAKNGLLAQINIAKTNPSNTTTIRYNYTAGKPADRTYGAFQTDVNPWFSIAEWVSRLMHCYDFIKEEFTETQQTLIFDWFYRWNVVFQDLLDSGLETLFVNRFAGNHTLKIQQGYTNKYTHLNADGSLGYRVPTIAASFNNRKFCFAVSMAMMAVWLGKEEDEADRKFMRSAVSYSKEWLTFSVFPDGSQGEMERGWNNDFEEQGWSYGGANVASYLQIADLLARHFGDRSLYEFRTSQGWLNTAGGPKDAFLAIKAVFNFLDGTWKRYSRNADNEQWLIDGWDTARGWYAVQDTCLAQFSNYYYLTKTTESDKNYIKNRVLRYHAGMRQFPTNPANGGPWPGWCIPSGRIPSAMFQCALFEGLVNPYF